MTSRRARSPRHPRFFRACFAIHTHVLPNLFSLRQTRSVPTAVEVPGTRGLASAGQEGVLLLVHRNRRAYLTQGKDTPVSGYHGINCLFLITETRAAWGAPCCSEPARPARRRPFPFGASARPPLAVQSSRRPRPRRWPLAVAAAARLAAGGKPEIHRVGPKIAVIHIVGPWDCRTS